MTSMPRVTGPGVGALAPAASHPTHALVTIKAPTTTSDAPRDESIRLFQSDAMVEDARYNLDLGSIADEDGALEQFDLKKGKFWGADLDLEQVDQAPMDLPTSRFSSALLEVAEVDAGALGSAASLDVALPKLRVQVSHFKQVEVMREEMHLGLAFATKAKEGISDSQDHKKFCSKSEGDLSLEASSKGADMFNGRKLHKKRTLDSDDAESSVVGPSSRRKNISTGGRTRGRGRGRVPSIVGYRSMLDLRDEDMPLGFL